MHKILKFLALAAVRMVVEAVPHDRPVRCLVPATQHEDEMQDSRIITLL
jgi:hypothetical protein